MSTAQKATLSSPRSRTRRRRLGRPCAAQRRLREHGDAVRVRMGLHVGHVERTATGYVGLEVHRAARVAAAAHGGQLLLTGAAVALAGEVVRTEPLGAHRLKDFPEPEQLFCAVVDGRGAGAFPPPRTAQVRPTNLSALTTTLIGRDEDFARVREALTTGGERLVTITGRGGTGKTSLARVVAESLLDAHPGGVWWVPLATIGAPEALLGRWPRPPVHSMRRVAPAIDAVVNHLRDRGRTLVVLDNLEHLLAAVRTSLRCSGPCPTCASW